MTEFQATTTSGTSMVLDEATVQGFKTSLRGPLLRPCRRGLQRHPASLERYD
jgi:hypothetical protein